MVIPVRIHAICYKARGSGQHKNTTKKMEDMQQEINKCATALAQGQLILYPTDTVWGIGCDATDPEAVSRVYALKQRPDHKALISLVAHQGMLERYVEKVPDLAYDLIDLAEKPLTIIYDSPKGLAKNLVGPDNTIAIRVASDTFCQRLIGRFGKPIVSTSANVAGRPTPASFREIGPEIANGVDYVVNLQRETSGRKPSSIIKMANDGTVKVIRE